MSALKQEFHHWQFRGTVFEQSAAHPTPAQDTAQNSTSNIQNSQKPPANQASINEENVSKAGVNKGDMLTTTTAQAQPSSSGAVGTEVTVHRNIADQQSENGNESFEPTPLQFKKKGTSVGEALKQRREEFDISEQEAATTLNMRLGQLRAIEQGRYEDLPGKTYTIGFIRSYAKFLGLDAEYTVRKFKEETGTVTAKEEILNFPIPASESRTPDTRVIVASIAGIIFLVVAMSIIFSGGEESAPIEIPPVAMIEGEVALTTDMETVGSGDMTAAGVVAEQSDNSAAAPEATTTASSTESTSAASNVAAETIIPDITSTDRNLGNADARPTIYGAANIDARVILRATENSWIEIRDSNGEVLLTRVLKAGDLYYVPNREGINLTTGNAGGLELIVDGTSKVSVGQRGQVLRGYDINPERLLKQPAQ